MASAGFAGTPEDPRPGCSKPTDKVDVPKHRIVRGTGNCSGGLAYISPTVSDENNMETMTESPRPSAASSRLDDRSEVSGRNSN